jgi:hypothetical protein
VGVHEPHPAKPLSTCALPPEVGQEEALVIADDHMLDATASIHDNADLSVELARDLGEERRELARDDLGRRDGAPEDALEGVLLGGLEADEMAGHSGRDGVLHAPRPHLRDEGGQR